MSFSPIGVIVKLLPNDGAGDVVDLVTSVPVFEVFVSSDLADGTTVTEVSLRFGTIELLDDSIDLTSFSKDACEVATLFVLAVLVKVVLVVSLAACFTSGNSCCDVFSIDFLLSFDFFTLLSCLKEGN